jgi:mono/diheme cytochrome c family protein
VRALVVLGYMAVALRAEATPRALPGWPLYDRLCSACHGGSGDGRGPAAPYTWGDPRDFTRGAFEWRTTPFGAAPSDDDLRRTLRSGAPGTSMPGFAGVVSDAELAELVAIVKAFAPAAFARTAPVVALGVEPPIDRERGARAWIQRGCTTCHGDGGHGDGAAAKTLAERPYDLATEPLRRPRDGDAPADRRRAAALSIATGMTGTPMPGYAGQIPPAEIWALADHVVELGARAQRSDRSALDADKIAADTSAVATWPGTDVDDASIFGAAIPAQGPAPASLAPAEASLASAQCGRCHAKQVREWETSLHAHAASPGLGARLADGVSAPSCRRCHAPLAEQASDIGEGVSCAGCHVRAWTRRGPPDVAPSLLARPGYPFAASTLYERGDFCMPCHQLPPRGAINGKPLLNTYKEWLEGPYMRRGIQCQSCHMPNREHQWLGVHDAATFRQGIRLDARARAEHGVFTITADLTNIGAGHFLPTTPTPAVWVRLELVDGDRVVGRFAQRIGRAIHWDGAHWHELEDTRIPPGETLHVARQWRGGHATAARVTIEVHPDDYYEAFYAERLAAHPAPVTRLLYEAALHRAIGSHYIAETRTIDLGVEYGP